MATRESKKALAETAALLSTDTQGARTYLRQVQRLAGPIPYVAIVTAMRRAGTSQVAVVAALAAGIALQDEPGRTWPC